MSETDVEELARIDQWAFERARPLLDAPQRRTPDLAAWARSTSDRVLLLAKELALTSPETYAENQLRISECLLDLNFIEAPRSVVSLRLGREARL
jgi:hypothetical protein